MHTFLCSRLNVRKKHFCKLQECFCYKFKKSPEPKHLAKTNHLSLISTPVNLRWTIPLNQDTLVFRHSVPFAGGNDEEMVGKLSITPALSRSIRFLSMSSSSSSAMTSLTSPREFFWVAEILFVVVSVLPTDSQVVASRSAPYK